MAYRYERVTARGLGITIAAAVVAAVATFLGLVYGLGMETMDAFYVAFTIGSAAAAAAAFTQKEANIGVVASAAALLMLIGLAGPYLGLQAILVFRTQTTTVYIPVEMLPWIMIGFIAFFAVGYVIGANVGRLALWTLGSILAMFWFAVTDPTAQVIIACIVALIAAVPLLSRQPAYGTLLSVAILPSARTQIEFDFTQVNYFGMLFTPLILFVALDPFNVVRNRVWRDLASVIVIFVAFLQVLSAVL